MNETIHTSKDLLSTLTDQGLRTRNLELAPGSMLCRYDAQPKGLFFIAARNSGAYSGPIHLRAKIAIWSADKGEISKTSHRSRL